MKKYGLRIRTPPSQQKKQTTRPPLRPPDGFRDDDYDDDERAVSRQAIKGRALKEIEEQQKKALEEDPTIFDYDGVYDEMKQQVAHPRAQDREERKPKYIMNLMRKAEERQREHEVVYERKIAKERRKEDHLYADKVKIATPSFKKKPAERGKWMEEERLRELRDEKEDVTKKSDLTDFYFNLEKNVAYGSKRPEKHTESSKLAEKKEAVAPGVREDRRHLSPSSSSRTEPSRAREVDRSDIPSSAPNKIEPRNEPAPGKERVPDDPASQEKGSVEPPSSSDQPKRNHHKRSEDVIAAARERLLARKRAKESQ